MSMSKFGFVPFILRLKKEARLRWQFSNWKAKNDSVQSLKLNPNSLQLMNLTSLNAVFLEVIRLKSQFLNLHSINVILEMLDFVKLEFMKIQLLYFPFDKGFSV